MFDSIATDPIANLQLTKLVLAIGSLGTAAYGVVDVTKGFGGGISNRGLGDINKVVSKFIPAQPTDGTGTSILALKPALDTLRANWLNGVALADQKAIAKALIKLNLTPQTAPAMATAAGVEQNLLASVADKISTGETLTAQETDVYGRFDLLLATALDQGYQRADQRYRNSAKLLAVPIAVILALVGAWALGGNALTMSQIWKAVAGGLIATPLAPVAKDLSSAIQAGAKVAQAWRK